MTEGVKTHGLHSGDGKPTTKGQYNMREAERTEGSTHNWTQGYQLPDEGRALRGSFKGRNSSEKQ